ncbi:hypothetical protein SAMN05444722_0238 [Rhodovulum sp. ES.010]|uniref:hypothetical protein n=1 Tax=Rhodovulum sp. ES.010 TaxID=1882821 RepID=UPI000929C808|nr:hypothetical protein [Rhodovulum sp. ES.010]SIO05031.1 hypothetical protein SAMN05444722_0238 [Rhodovulum sp. ES.010]
MCTTEDHTSRAMCRTASGARKLIRGKLGPAPGATLQAMSGYGLSESDLARYFGVTPSSIRRLKRSLNVSAPCGE